MKKMIINISDELHKELIRKQFEIVLDTGIKVSLASLVVKLAEQQCIHNKTYKDVVKPVVMKESFKEETGL